MAGFQIAPAAKPTDPEKITLEAWSQGFMVGALIVMAVITLVNLRKGVLLHKLILIEVCGPEQSRDNGQWVLMSPGRCS